MVENYERVNWKDAPETDTPVSARLLNQMDKGIEDNNVAIRLIERKVGDLDEVQLSTGGSEGNGIKFGVNEDGEYGYYKAGADTLTPFKFPKGELVIEGNGTYDISEYERVIIQVDNKVYQLVATITSSVSYASKYGDQYFTANAQGVLTKTAGSSVKATVDLADNTVSVKSQRIVVADDHKSADVYFILHYNRNDRSSGQVYGGSGSGDGSEGQYHLVFGDSPTATEVKRPTCNGGSMAIKSFQII